MPLMNVRQSIGASASVENLFTGSAFEYLPHPAGVELGLVQLSGNFGDIVADISSGSDILAENMPLTVRSTGVNVADDLYLEDIAAAGDRLKVRVRNTTAGAIVVQAMARLTWLG